MEWVGFCLSEDDPDGSLSVDEAFGKMGRTISRFLDFRGAAYRETKAEGRLDLGWISQAPSPLRIAGSPDRRLSQDREGLKGAHP